MAEWHYLPETSCSGSDSLVIIATELVPASFLVFSAASRVNRLMTIKAPSSVK